MATHSCILAWRSHRQRSLSDYSPWGHKKLDTTEQLSLQFICIKVNSQSIQLFSSVPLLATPWTAACQASLSITNSRSWFKLMPFESAMPSNHLVPRRPSPAFNLSQHRGLFLMSQFFAMGGQSTGGSASSSFIFAMNIQD